MKKLLISAMIAACLIAIGAQAQTYNATGSERQAASNDMGMYQLTLEAFRKSEYYLNPQTRQAKIIHDAIDVTNFGVGRQVLILPNGQITSYKTGSTGNLIEVTKWKKSGYSNKFDASLIEDSALTLSEFNKTASYQRIVYLSFSDIAEKSFPVIRSKKMNRQAAVKYLSQRIDSELSDLIVQNNIEVYSPRMTSSVPSTSTLGAESGIAPRCGAVQCFPADGHGYVMVSNNNVVIGGFNEWSAIWDDGVVLKSNYGQVDLSNRGRPWFSEAGIKGEKLSIAGSSDKGSSTSQKRGE